MAGSTCDGCVSVRQARHRMGCGLHRGRLPKRLGMAIGTGGAELPLVNILVAIGAKRELELSVLWRFRVALDAGRGLVGAAERKSSQVVIERVELELFPGSFVVAIGARRAEAVLVHVLMA